MTATIGVMPTKERYAKVSQVKTQIYEAEEKLHSIRQKEKLKTAERGSYLQLPDTMDKDRRLDRVEAEIVVVQTQKTRLTDQVDELKNKLPQAEAEAQDAEQQLKLAYDNRKNIKSEIEEADKKLNDAIKPLIDLIEHRNTIIHNFEKTGDEIQSLNGQLRWHPLAREASPAEPEMLRKLRDLLHPQPWKRNG